MPPADLLGPGGGAVGQIIDRFAEQPARVDLFVHGMQIHLGEQPAAFSLAQLAVVIAFRVPFDQHIADVKDHRLRSCHCFFPLCEASRHSMYSPPPQISAIPVQAVLSGQVPKTVAPQKIAIGIEAYSKGATSPASHSR